MVRGAPSSADQYLIEIAARLDMKLSVARLERWRQAGLIPRPNEDTLEPIGRRSIYSLETTELVMGLLFFSKYARKLDDLILLAFFNGAPVPADPVKRALIKVYFPSYVEHREKGQQLLDIIPEEHRAADPPEYNWAEVSAGLDMESHSEAVGEMRRNLRRRRDLRHATQEELSERVRGVLIWLSAPSLPVHDAVFMDDLRSALAFDGPAEQSRGAWLLAAICHSEQRALRKETSFERRLQELLAVDDMELQHLREVVTEWADAIYILATGGRRGRKFSFASPKSARQAGAMLVEWISMRQVHPPGSRPAQILVESLHSLWAHCSDVPGADASGEGRTTFIIRTRRHPRT